MGHIIGSSFYIFLHFSTYCRGFFSDVLPLKGPHLKMVQKVSTCCLEQNNFIISLKITLKWLLARQHYLPNCFAFAPSSHKCIRRMITCSGEMNTTSFLYSMGSMFWICLYNCSFTFIYHQSLKEKDLWSSSKGFNCLSSQLSIIRSSCWLICFYILVCVCPHT